MKRNKSFDKDNSPLYLIATPIGNLKEFSSRAIEVVSDADIVAAEDTRNAYDLLIKFGIKKETYSLREHNEKEASQHLISINRAKNQMLAINIPKLSGQCGKLICCLKYEDDAYTEERKKFPDLGSKYFIDKVEYTVTSVNILSRVVKIENDEDIKFLPLEDFNKQVGGQRNKERRYEKK